MKKKFFGTKVGKILLIIGCIIVAFAFWFVVEYTQLGAISDVLNIC